MTTGSGPYVVPNASDIDTSSAKDVVEVTIIADETLSVDIGDSVTANVQTFNGTIRIQAPRSTA